MPDDTVTLLLKAAMAAPTAVNKQPWAFVVVNERAMLDSLAEVLPYARMLKQAPLAVVPCGDMTRALEGNGRDFWILYEEFMTDPSLRSLQVYYDVDPM